MIIKGGAAGNVGFWSSHLLRDDTNERAEVVECRGLSASTLRDALREMQAVAAGSRCQGNFMYQANINPRTHERMTPEQWARAIDTLERNLGLSGHQRVVVAHMKGRREHRHVIWNRVDTETMLVAGISGNYRIHEMTARQLETVFALLPTQKQGAASKSRPAQFWERERGKRSGFDPSAITAQVSTLWSASDNGRAFAAALHVHGFILAKGDRRGVCLIDPAGDVHSLARRLDGVTTAQLRAHLSDIDRDRLPTVEAARAIQGKRGPRRDRERGGASASGAAEAIMVQPERSARYVAADLILARSFRHFGDRHA